MTRFENNSTDDDSNINLAGTGLTTFRRITAQRHHDEILFAETPYISDGATTIDPGPPQD